MTAEKSGQSKCPELQSQMTYRNHVPEIKDAKLMNKMHICIIEEQMQSY